MQYQYTRRGFTLIELLVVVLIIGILAAVALPQYQFAVNKARYMDLVTAVESIYKAQQMFKLSEGYYTMDFNALDIRFDEWDQSTAKESGEVYAFQTNQYRCVLSTNPEDSIAQYIMCWTGGDLGYGRWLRSTNEERVCMSRWEEGARFCKRITGIEKEQGFSNGNWWLWPFQN